MSPITEDQLVPTKTINWLMVGMILLLLLLVALLFIFLPDNASGIPINEQSRWVLLVAVCGGLGAYVHMAQSFVSFVGLKKFQRSWIWWYVMRPFIGMALALIFFLVYGSATETDLSGASGTGILAVAAVVGLFSKQAIDKLSDIFDVILKSDTSENIKKEDTDTNKPNQTIDPDQGTVG